MMGRNARVVPVRYAVWLLTAAPLLTGCSIFGGGDEHRVEYFYDNGNRTAYTPSYSDLICVYPDTRLDTATLRQMLAEIAERYDLRILSDSEIAVRGRSGFIYDPEKRNHPKLRETGSTFSLVDLASRSIVFPHRNRGVFGAILA